jgi:hypothetical protein
MCASESSSSVYNACQLAKSHQLPFSSSIHKSSAPLELIFSDVWGHAPQSSLLGVLNIISVSSMILVNFLGFICTEAAHNFLQFQTHVEHLLDTKIKCVQSD